MQFKQTLVRLLFLVFPFAAYAQTTYLPEGSKEYILLNRLEIKAQKDSVLNFSKIKPFSREQIIPILENYYKTGTFIKGVGEIPMTLDSNQLEKDEIGARMTNVDLYNARIALENSSEWANVKFTSKKPFLKTFYKTPANFYEVNVKDFFLAVNPLFQYVVGKEQNNSENIFLNTRGIAVRGRIANKIGFATSITDNQERDPFYVQELVTAHKAVPGQGFYKEFKTTGYDYFDARGYFTFGITKYIDVQFGYDKNYIGNGYRSLFLSDISSPMLFLKFNTRIWKFNYQNLFMELNTANRLNADQLLPKKYAAMHHLDMQFTKWLNVGLFEGVIFGRTNHFEFGYLNPIIFYRSIELQNGSFDNALVGMDAKANVAKKFQFYGQFLLDEFNLEQMRKGSGWWGNKFGYQLGVKYIDAFNIRNLDIQLESNRIRPFTYSHNDSVANYTHYNQPLAHPIGANFQELIGIARYQPAPRWMIEAKAIYYYQGRDTGSISYGSNIFLPDGIPPRTMDYGYSVGTGIKTKVAYTSLLLSFEVKPNLYLEATGVYRKEGATTVAPAQNTSVIYFGVRWNLARREFDY